MLSYVPDHRWDPTRHVLGVYDFVCGGGNYGQKSGVLPAISGAEHRWLPNNHIGIPNGSPGVLPRSFQIVQSYSSNYYSATSLVQTRSLQFLELSTDGWLPNNHIGIPNAPRVPSSRSKLLVTVCSIVLGSTRN